MNLNSAPCPTFVRLLKRQSVSSELLANFDPVGVASGLKTAG